MLNYRKVYEIYDSCLTWACGWLDKHGYRVNAISTEVKEANKGYVIIKTKEPLHCRDWKQRDGSHERIDILVSSIETISLEKEACTAARLCVSYFRIAGKKAIAIESLHYDYVHPPEKQHPICHVQNSNDVPGTFPNSFNYEVERSAIEKRCQNVRIPSAFVNLPGLFAILAADHMSRTDWCEFIRDYCVHFRKIPAIAEHTVVNQVKEGLCVWDWYEM